MKEEQRGLGPCHALTVDVIDAYVEVLPEDGQIDVALARARAVRHEQAG